MEGKRGGTSLGWARTCLVARAKNKQVRSDVQLMVRKVIGGLSRKRGE